MKMITGDQLVIAKEVAVRLGLPPSILHASHLNDKSVSEAEITNKYVFHITNTIMANNNKKKMFEFGWICTSGARR